MIPLGDRGPYKKPDDLVCRRVQFKLTRAEYAALMRLCGPTRRSTYLRAMVLRAIKRENLKGRYDY